MHRKKSCPVLISLPVYLHVYFLQHRETGTKVTEMWKEVRALKPLHRIRSLLTPLTLQIVFRRDIVAKFRFTLVQASNIQIVLDQAINIWIIPDQATKNQFYLDQADSLFGQDQATENQFILVQGMKFLFILVQAIKNRFFLEVDRSKSLSILIMQTSLIQNPENEIAQVLEIGKNQNILVQEFSTDSILVLVPKASTD